MNKSCFLPADILLPRRGFESWAVIACDQFTSDREYWNSVEKIVGDKPSSLRLTLPEIYLSDNPEQRTKVINKAMLDYCTADLFLTLPSSMIYVERVQKNGRVRRGIVGAVDLEAYDYRKGSKTLIRATEETVPDRLPPRIKIRSGASLELPHVMLLINDPKNSVIMPFDKVKERLDKLYDFELMMSGGHIRGYALGEKDTEAVENALNSLSCGDNPLLFAVGDGNHSLAAAKECYLANPTEKNRYALVEIVNIHDEALVFEPIYRVLFGISPDIVIKELKESFGTLDYKNGCRVRLLSSQYDSELSLKPDSALTVGTVQSFINRLLVKYPGVTVDYIHEAETVKSLAAKPDTVGFLFDGMRKEELFPAVETDGALPRKTFSMGEGCDKRYYIEARKII